MNKQDLYSKIKSTQIAYVFWFFFGAHYAYLRRWETQFLYWFTLGGLGVWAIIDLFTMSNKIAKHNSVYYHQLDEINRRQRDQEYARNLDLIRTLKSA